MKHGPSQNYLKENMQLDANEIFTSKLNQMDPFIAIKHV